MSTPTYDSQGFWSYVHKDDAAEGERISRLATDLVDQYEMLTGESISLFLDKVALKWGDRWKDKVDESLASVAFFIPVLTPRYLQSTECRRELHYFARRATHLGVKELVLPILYADIPQLHDDDCQDELVLLIRSFQWVDWRKLRYSEVSAGDYRQGVSALAERLVQANRQAERADVANNLAPEEDPTESSDDELPGTIDNLAKSEEALPHWQASLEGIGEEIEEIGKIMNEGNAAMRNPAQGASSFALKLKVAKEIAQRLEGPTNRIWTFSNESAAHLHDVDAGFRVIIESAPGEIESDPSALSTMQGFFKTVQSLSESSHTAFGAMNEMLEAVAPLERMSRDLRPPMRKLRQGLEVLMEARDVSDEWVQLIADSGVMSLEEENESVSSAP